MAILTNKDGIFILETEHTQYVMGVGTDSILYHIYWGAPCKHSDFFALPGYEKSSNHSELDLAKTEYTPFGGTMYRDCAFKCTYADKTRDCVLKYKEYAVQGDTLHVFLEDAAYGLCVKLSYTVYPACDILSRSATVCNNSDADIMLERAFSAEFSLPSRQPYHIYNSNGTWSGEQQKVVQELACGSLQFESRKGISGHGNTPAFIAAQHESETQGEVFFGALEYSGNFKVSLNRDAFGITRALIGVNDFDFSHTLHKGDAFTAPCVHFGFAESLSDMSNHMNDFAMQHVFPEPFRDEPLPVLYNSWEATEFDVCVEEQKKLAEAAAKIGVELFVMDDGWFGERNSDRAGLGDWTVNPEKFPNGLSELIDHVNTLGMDFGIWFEPEMVNPDSALYRAHPDWTYHYERRTPNELRHQLVLNLTKPEVQDYVFDCVDKVLSAHNIKYVKWDMNRPFSEIGTENLENGKMLWYLHTQALYAIVDKLKARHPQTQFEACASGGGRCDFGAIRHFDQIWTSDNTDAIDRIHIQDGYSLLYPTKYMRAWVTDLKWHNPAPLKFRFNVAMQGALGIGTNLLKMSDEELALCAEQIAFYKKLRRTVQFGKKYRLLNLERDELSVNQYVSRDGKESVVFVVTPSTRFLHHCFSIRLNGLEPDAQYRVRICESVFEKSGAFLMNAGIEQEISGQYVSQIWTIEKL